MTATALSAAPTPQDFPYGLPLQVQPDKPLQELKVPDAVYSGVLREDLGDLRVFNDDDVVIPHALCGPATAPQQPQRWRKLPMFVLRDSNGNTSSGIQVEIETAEGTRVQVMEPVAPSGASNPGDPAAPEARPSAYIVDARGLEGELQAIHPQRPTAGGPSEGQVRVWASDDLQRWRIVVPSATMLRAQSQDGALVQNRIALPATNYQYLRLGGVDGDAPEIDAVTAEIQPTAGELDAVTITARASGGEADDAVFRFDSERLAPMYRAKVQLPMPNMSLVVELSSRNAADAAWQRRWRGEIYSLSGVIRPADWGPIRFTPTSDRYWRVKVLNGAESLAGKSPQLSLGYYPQRLRFLAQGEPPYTIAYGSAGATSADGGCERLLGSMPKQQRRSMTGEAGAAATVVALGGEQALKPSPEPTEARPYLLWAVLIAGALVLIAMALSLLRRIRPQ